MKAFLSYSYDSRGEALAENFRPLLESLGVELVTGKRPRGNEKLTDQIRLHIDSCDLLVALDSGAGLSPWVLSEASYARGHGAPVICITARGNRPEGLLSDDFYISLARGELHAATAVVETVSTIDAEHGPSGGSEPDWVRMSIGLSPH